MLHGASTTPLMAELTLLGLGIPRQNPSFTARSATQPTLAPDGLAQICCNLCTAVQWFVGLQQAPLSAGRGVTADLVSDKAYLVIIDRAARKNGSDRS